jgi:acetoin utilization protein AcuB
MLVKDVMTTEIITINPKSSIIELLEKYKNFRHHTFPVIDKGDRLIGIVALADIMKIFMPHSPSLTRLLKAAHFYHGQEGNILETELNQELINNMVISDIMNHNIITIEAHETIAEARSEMTSHDIRYMPVIEGQRLVGVITVSDIIMGLFKERRIIA